MAAKRIGRAVVLSLAVLPLPFGALAEGLVLGGKGSRSAAFQSQVALLEGRLSQQYSGSVRLKPGAEADKDATKVRYSGRYKGEYLDVARAAARKHGVPEDLFLRLVQRESGWNPGVVSSKGAIGLAQLMPGTADLLSVDPNDPADNLDGGARYLAMMYSRFGSWKLALAAYNAGPGAVEEAGNTVPDFEETKAYVAAILG
ncbi:lytic transglycosylase domain-containing protein [Stagnihabitans tardus]|uniref:Transglycosylase SLT domain-containing protein n=1 Tax=Stagnihabitans tardus TaxID=2699202 RepID=A0AAE4YAS5_9RHOB|nr:lytic transglycosylase domain-containing protein [Stagnihabitans tardus]NBZ87878.1 transglycosylase SLT domain-containing protein [Stagnihabitans tardus]